MSTQNTPAIKPAKSNLPENPFRSNSHAEHVNAGTVSIESERAIAEVQAKMVIAKRFPRDEGMAYDRAMQACSRYELASIAQYRYPRGGQTISGPSIRLAEELARCYGNIVYGIRELSRKDGVSEMQAFAWDLETNVESTQNFTVRHLRDKTGGSVALTDERDIYEITANMGGRRLRSRLLAILPPDLVSAAVNQCQKTLAGGNGEPLSDRIKKMFSAFSAYNVSAKHITDYLNKRTDEILGEDVADLTAIFVAIRDGHAKPSDYFGGTPKVADTEVKESGGQKASAPAVEKAPAATRRNTRAKAEEKAQPAKAEQQQQEGPADHQESAQAEELQTGHNDTQADDGNQTSIEIDDGSQAADDDFDSMFGSN